MLRALVFTRINIHFSETLRKQLSSAFLDFDHLLRIKIDLLEKLRAALLQFEVFYAHIQQKSPCLISQTVQVTFGNLYLGNLCHWR